VKAPVELAAKLARQWHNPGLRERRLLSPDAWPMELPIGKPTAAEFAQSPARVREHIERWRELRIGEVVWDRRGYRLADEPVALPLRWRLRKPSEWVRACGERQVGDDYALLSRLIEATDAQFHALLIRRLPQLRTTPEPEIIQSARIALQLQPGSARGRPLRALSLGNDSKFFERHRRLLIGLLDLRFEGAVSEQGLESFLDAVDERDHWLLLAPLDKGMLPFRQLRVRAGELQRTPLPAGRILLVENEQCLHQLPRVADCTAVLGSGLHLEWLRADWLGGRRLVYWGDLDTWGLAMLAKARLLQPQLEAVMMERAVFERFSDRAVAEPVPYGGDAPVELTPAEKSLYQFLLGLERGRLEQEFLPEGFVAETLLSVFGGGR